MLQINFTPFPALETERLSLRNIKTSDAEVILKLRSDPAVMRFVPRPLLKDLAGALEHVQMISDKITANEGINWSISKTGEEQMVGIIGLFRIKPESYRAEVGYMLLPEYSGRGYVSEALQEVVRYGFEEMELNSVEAIIDPANIASERVLQKNGFVKEAHLLENEFFDGRFLDTVIYSLLKRNFTSGS